MSILASVIVPVYNVEKYLAQNIESLLSDKNSELEFIFVNDGSVDGSLDILEEYAQKDERIVIITQKNQGQSAARNVGIRRAQGEYLVFVDSDDFVEKDSITRICLTAKDIDLDILQIAFDKVDEQGRKIPLSKNESNIMENKREEVMSGKEWLICKRITSIVWIYMYRREFIIKNAIFFVEGHVHEDIEFVPRAIYYAERVMYTAERLYHYRIRKGSTVMRKDIERIKDAFFIIRRMEDFCKREVEEKTYRCFYKEYIVGSYANSINNAIRNQNVLSLLFENERERKRLGKLLCESNKRKYRFMGMCIKGKMYIFLMLSLYAADTIRGIR